MPDIPFPRTSGEDQQGNSFGGPYLVNIPKIQYTPQLNQIDLQLEQLHVTTRWSDHVLNSK